MDKRTISREVCHEPSLTFGDKRVYVAGDTENVPEMADLKGIDVAFLPMNLPYTMTPEMVAEAALMRDPSDERDLRGGLGASPSRWSLKSLTSLILRR